MLSEPIIREISTGWKELIERNKQVGGLDEAQRAFKILKLNYMLVCSGSEGYQNRIRELEKEVAGLKEEMIKKELDKEESESTTASS